MSISSQKFYSNLANNIHSNWDPINPNFRQSIRYSHDFKYTNLNGVSFNILLINKCYHESSDTSCYKCEFIFGEKDEDTMDDDDDDGQFFRREWDEDIDTIIFKVKSEKSCKKLSLALKEIFRLANRAEKCKECNINSGDSLILSDDGKMCMECYTTNYFVSRAVPNKKFKCFICCKEFFNCENADYCDNKHTDLMCKKCRGQISKCPLCRKML